MMDAWPAFPAIHEVATLKHHPKKISKTMKISVKLSCLWALVQPSNPCLILIWSIIGK